MIRGKKPNINQYKHVDKVGKQEAKKLNKIKTEIVYYGHHVDHLHTQIMYNPFTELNYTKKEIFDFRFRKFILYFQNKYKNIHHYPKNTKNSMLLIDNKFIINPKTNKWRILGNKQWLYFEDRYCLYDVFKRIQKNKILYFRYMQMGNGKYHKRDMCSLPKSYLKWLIDNYKDTLIVYSAYIELQYRESGI